MAHQPVLVYTLNDACMHHLYIIVDIHHGLIYCLYTRTCVVVFLCPQPTHVQLIQKMGGGFRNFHGRGESIDFFAQRGKHLTSTYDILDENTDTGSEYHLRYTKPRINFPFDPSTFFRRQIDKINGYENDDYYDYDYDDETFDVSDLIATQNKYRSRRPMFVADIFQRISKDTCPRSNDNSNSVRITNQRVGTSVGLLSSDLQHSLMANFDWRSATLNVPVTTTVTPPQIANSQFPSAKASIEYNFNRDTRDDKLLPTKGYSAKLNTEVAGIFGGDVDFFKIWTRFEKHVPYAGGAFNFGFQSGFVTPWKRYVFGSKFKGDESIRIVDRLVPKTGLDLELMNFDSVVAPKGISCSTNGYNYANYKFLTAIGMSFTFPLLKHISIYGNFFLNAMHTGSLHERARASTMGANAGVSVIIPLSQYAKFEAGYTHPLYNRNNLDTHKRGFFWKFGISF